MSDSATPGVAAAAASGEPIRGAGGDLAATYAAIVRQRVFAILRPADGDDPAAQLAALADGGLHCAEISLATPAGRAALPRCTAALGERLLLGAGTVRTVADAQLAVDAGARFLVSPGCAPDVQAWARDNGVAHLPGVLTPSELDAALQAGAPLVKLFPAGRLGPAYVKDLLAPFPDARLVATGAVGLADAPDYLAAGAAAVALGSALAPSGADADRDDLTRRAATVLRALAPRTDHEAS